MTAATVSLIGLDYKLVSGTTDSGRRWAQFWFLTKFGPRVADECVAWMGDPPLGTSLSVGHGCPADLIDEVLEAWAVFRAGGLPAPTHEMKWEMGMPWFTPVSIRLRSPEEES